jgi:VCBS repeat-containing protein
MNTWKLSALASAARRLASDVALVLILAPGVGLAQSLSINFSEPVDWTEDAPFTGTISFSPSSMVVTGSTTAGASIVPSSNISIAGTNVTVVPLTNATGAATIQLVGKAPGSTNTVSFRVDFNAVNDAPTIAPISDVTINEDASTNVVLTLDDVDDNVNTLDVDVLSGNTALIDLDAGDISGNGASRTLALAPITNQYGTATITVRVTDGQLTNSTSFLLTVNAVNDPPTISAISNVSVNEDAATNRLFTIGDPDNAVTSLVLNASVDNTALISVTSTNISGSGTNRTITLTPRPNQNGSATVTVSVADGSATNASSFRLTVDPVADPSTITGLANRAFSSSVGVTNVFSGVGIGDVDHNMPLPEQLVGTALLTSGQFATFANGQTTYGFTGQPAQVTAAMAGLGVQALPFRSLPGTINNVGASIRVRGVADNITVTGAVNLAIESANTAPTFGVTLNPTSVAEGVSSQPLFLTFVYDPDIGEDEFTLAIQFVNTNQSGLLTFAPTNVLSDNAAGLQALIRNVSVTAGGAMTAAVEQVALRFVLTDGYGGSTAQTNVLTLVQDQSPPQITGVPVQTINKTDADPAFIVYPTAFVQDSNQGGLQPVRVVLSQSNPALGTFSATSFPYMTPAQISTALQAVAYTPTPGALPVGQNAESVFTLKVTDFSGLSASNNSVKVRISSVNQAPRILNVPPPESQPVLIPPADPLLPFKDLGLTSDDTNQVVFTVSIDDTGKGSLTNLGAFVETSPGELQWSGTPSAILASLTNIAYVLNPGYAFPPDDPGGTVFTLSARDYALLASTKTLYIQVQEAPRNHLVVRAENDGFPGSLVYALSQAGNNDVITFALSAYPAVVRMPGSVPATLTRNLTLKGPGANLLTISGDGNGDNVPDRQLFRIRSRVVIEGVTLSRGAAAFGGAVQVENGGALTLTRCAVVDCEASEYGGAIDVDGGQLTLDGCFIGRNRLAGDTGISGAGVSVYSDKEIRIANTTFADNVQPNPEGDGGGALVVQNLTVGTALNAYVTHCTFVGNEDAAGRASAALSVDFGTRIRPWNSIFGDASGRNIDVLGAGEVMSQGGNICDDSSRTSNQQQGEGGRVFLLDHATDATLTDPALAPLNLSGDPTPYAEPLAGSPAIEKGVGSTVSVDQRGVLRQGTPDAGAAEFGALGRLAINEIHFDTNAVNFIEIYVRRDSTPIDLAPYSLFVDGVKVHDFAASTIIGTNALFTAGAAASTLVNPGFGIVVAFTNRPLRLTSDSNPTPVVRPSNTNAVLDLEPRGVITMGHGGSMEPVARQAYLGAYLDPSSGTNILSTSGNSVALAPQFRGFSLVPHSLVLPGPFEGVDMARNRGVNQHSIGADTLGTPFGQANAEPLAVPDLYTVAEDDVAALPVLNNDFDGDGNDRLVVVDVSTTTGSGTGDTATTNTQLGARAAVDPIAAPLRGERIVYDPRGSAALQALPVGVEAVDTFYYEAIDIGSAPVEGYADAGGGTTVVAATSHRLTNGAQVAISGAAPAAYNGTHAVRVVGQNAFAIGVPFAGAATSNGTWTTSLPRAPTSRSEASVSIRVLGANDPPVAATDVITGVTERATVRLMVRPELAGAPLSFPTDPVPPPAALTQDVLSNDDDVDTDDSWDTLRVVGVLGGVHAIGGYSGVPGQSPVTVSSPAHGLSSGDEILIANYGGHPSYNGYHTVTVLDDGAFTIPVFFVDDAAAKGVWVILDDANRYGAVTDVGSTVSLTLRANPEEDHFIFSASASGFLRGLAAGERYTNRFYYAVEDRHGGTAIGAVDVVIAGVNDRAVVHPDPDGLAVLDPLVSPSNALEDVLSGGLDLMYALPAMGGGSNRVDLHVLDPSGALPGTIVLSSLWATDEDTALAIDVQDLLANDSDIDRIDTLNVVSVESLSREGSALSLGGGWITYDPTGSTNLQALAREELIVDAFHVVVSDGKADGLVTGLVAVTVVGMNDSPVALADLTATSEDDALTLNPLVFPTNNPAQHDVEVDRNGVPPDDRLAMIAVSNRFTMAGALVDIAPLVAQYDPTVSVLLNQLADWQSYTDRFDYTAIDHSFVFAGDDEFHVPAGSSNTVLDVLANDRDYTDVGGPLRVVEVGPTLHGGTVGIGTNGLHLVYDAPPLFVGDDYFFYTVENSAGDRNEGTVMVRATIPQLNGVLNAADDHLTVAAGETVVMNVTANDNILPFSGSGLVISSNLVSTSQPGQPVLAGNAFTYTATNGLAPLVFTYEVTAGGEARALANVTVNIVERRGTLVLQDDEFSVLPGSIDNELDVLFNDSLLTEPTSHLRLLGLLDAAMGGAISTNSSGTAVVYSPDPGFVGVERIRYVATDGLGGTGTGTLSIVVGAIEVASDYFVVAATTNPVPVLLDVLANDRMLPNPLGTLSVVSVSPSNAVSIGTLDVGGGAALAFTPSGSNVVGQADFQYVVQDASAPARTATGRVTIAAAAGGVFANPDRYVVRAESADVELNVLANDVSHPGNGASYSILGIGTGADAPNAGGTVSIVDNRLLYTPAEGFRGEESFTYQMTDSVGTDSARVTVSVEPGDLFANRDAFKVYYELEPGTNAARAFTVPVTWNDRILPPFDQVIQIVGVGVDTTTQSNAPSQQGEVSIAPDGLSLQYRPVTPAVSNYIERFTYEISAGTDRRAEGRVEILVQNRASNLVAVTQDDAFAVERNSASNMLAVLLNDFVLPGSGTGWTITAVSAPAFGGTATISGKTIRYAPPVDFVGLDQFAYTVTDGLGGTGSAEVRVRVGALPVQPDSFEVVSGYANYELDVLANDLLDLSYAGEYVLDGVFGISGGGQATVGPANTLLYTPDPAYAGAYPYTETFYYSVADENTVSATGLVRVAVYEAGSDRSTTNVTIVVAGRNDAPVIDNPAMPLAITDKETARPFVSVLFTEVDEQTLERVDATVALDDAAKGFLRNLDGFREIAPGAYALTNVTAAHATERINDLVFVPTENRITVPGSEDTRFTITVSDNKSPPAVDTNAVVTVTALNDAPEILGTRSGQILYDRVPIRLFSSVSIVELDDLGLQPLAVTVTMLPASRGMITNLGSFAVLTGGVYRATNIAAAAATAQLRGMEFLLGTNRVPVGSALTSNFQIVVNDGFAAPVQDDRTSVIAYNAFEGTLRPTNAAFRGSFGLAVDTLSDVAVVGALNANANGAESGAAFVYRRQPGSTNTWVEWMRLQPGMVETNDHFGRSVAIDDDLIAVGAMNDEVGTNEVGAVYLFKRDLGGSNAWGELIRIAPTNVAAPIRFGYSVALEGDRLAVGAPDASLSGSGRQGAVFVFERNQGGSNAWGEVARRVPADPGITNSDFGWSVSLSGDDLVVGAPRNNVDLATTNREGAAYFLSRHAGGSDNWGVAQRFTAAQTNESRDFGWSVSVDGDLLGIGAPSMNSGFTFGAGIVFLYERAAGSNLWMEISRLDRRDDSERQFGQAVAVKGDRVLVGAPHNGSPPNIGAAYLYRRSPTIATNWNLIEKLTRPPGSTAGLFGAAAGLDVDAGIIGAPSDVSDTSNRGFAFMYRFKQNNAPVAAVPIEDQEAHLGEPFDFPIPEGSFADPDVDDALSLFAAFPAGGNGLVFNGLSVTGVPVAIGLTPVDLTATDSSGASAAQTFQVVVLDDAGLTGSPRDFWNLAHFGNAVTNPASEASLWGGSANPDGDGWNNDQEYAFGGDPFAADDQRITLEPDGAGNLVIRYCRQIADPALAYELQGSEGMELWESVESLVIGEAIVAVGEERECVTVTIRVNDATRHLHYRLLVIR